MELSISGLLKRTGQTARTAGAAAGRSAAQASSSVPQPRTDSLAWSRQVADFLRAQDQRITEQALRSRERKSALWELDEAEGGSSESDALGESLKTMQRCQKIAARIMRGDKVPPQDEQYLMQNDPEGYKLAMAMRTPKRNPKKWESVLEEEEKESSKDGSGEDVQEASACGASGADSGAGAGEGGACGE